jgi:hypothetical protein
MAGSGLMAGKSKVSTDDWTPPAGMTKRVCADCEKPFSSRALSRCANCISIAPHRKMRARDDPRRRPTPDPAAPT